MADYKQLKTITIDGETMGLQEGLGETKFVNQGITNFPTSWSWTDGASVTLEAKKAYVIRYDANFPNASSTGTRVCALCITATNGSSGYTKITSGDNQSVIIQGCVFRRASASSADITYKVQVASNKGVSGNTVNTSITATEILGIPTT